MADKRQRELGSDDKNLFAKIARIEGELGRYKKLVGDYQVQVATLQTKLTRAEERNAQNNANKMSEHKICVSDGVYVYQTLDGKAGVCYACVNEGNHDLFVVAGGAPQKLKTNNKFSVRSNIDHSGPFVPLRKFLLELTPADLDAIKRKESGGSLLSEFHACVRNKLKDCESAVSVSEMKQRISTTADEDARKRDEGTSSATPPRVLPLRRNCDPVRNLKFEVTITAPGKQPITSGTMTGPIKQLFDCALLTTKDPGANASRAEFTICVWDGSQVPEVALLGIPGAVVRAIQRARRKKGTTTTTLCTLGCTRIDIDDADTWTFSGYLEHSRLSPPYQNSVVSESPLVAMPAPYDPSEDVGYDEPDEEDDDDDEEEDSDSGDPDFNVSMDKVDQLLVDLRVIHRNLFKYINAVNADMEKIEDDDEEEESLAARRMAAEESQEAVEDLITDVEDHQKKAPYAEYICVDPAIVNEAMSIEPGEATKGSEVYAALCKAGICDGE